MQFCNYNEINLHIFHLDIPYFDFDNNVFISKLFDNNDNHSMNIKSDSLRLLNLKDDTLQMEFLYSSNNFYNFINNLDMQSKNEIIKNGFEWFGNSLNIDTIDNLFKQSVILPTKIPGLPTINFKCDDLCKITSNKKKKLSKNDLKPNMEIELCFVVDGIHFYKNKCHLIYNVKQIKILNDICQSFESLFKTNEDDDYQNNCNGYSEINDITASTFYKV